MYLKWHEDPAAFFRYYVAGCRMLEAAGGLVFDDRQRMLVMIRHGIPDFPKGHLDKDETCETAALREVTEETGLTALHIVAQAPETWHAYRQNDRWCLKRTQWFIMKVKGNQLLRPQIEEGITELFWTEHSDLETYLKNTYRSLCDTLGPTIMAYALSGRSANG
ncbi:MAG TPA: NUDIX domain-containing protein [Bacteroidales bacterium]|nr:NUDIX domain-containing protein [Bacteroidales bacterium]